MFPAILHLHLLGGIAHRPDMEALRLLVLPEGGGPRAQRSQTEGAEGREAEQAGIRGYFHDGGQGLGWRADFRANHYRENPGKERDRR